MDTHQYQSERSNKKIWIDLDNSPHVLFFNPIIKELKKRGYQVVVTARDYAQVIGLVELFDIHCKPVGHHYGKNKIFKIMGLLIRSLQMIPTVIDEKPHLALSHGSRSQNLVAKLFGISTALAFDYEHTQWLPFIRPKVAIVPDVLPKSVVEKKAERVSQYPGIKEDVYVPYFVPDPTILEDFGIHDGDVVVTVRPPATVAHYYAPQSSELFEEAIDYICRKENTRVIIVPRTDDQGIAIEKTWRNYVMDGKITIPDRVVDGLNLIWHSDLVISGGGTMNREAAALGVPVYSIFRGKIGAVDRYLAESGRLTLVTGAEDIRTKIILAKRQRPPLPEQNNHAALDKIVDIIGKIVGPMK